MFYEGSTRLLERFYRILCQDAGVPLDLGIGDLPRRKQDAGVSAGFLWRFYRGLEQVLLGSYQCLAEVLPGA